MVSLLSNTIITEESIKLFGRLIYRLLIANNKCPSAINVIDSVIIDTREFGNYLQTRYLTDSFINGCLSLVHRFDSSLLDVSVSVPRYSLMDVNPLVVRPSVAELRNTITHLYESWFDEKVYGYRTARRIPAEYTYPAIVIQPHFGHIDTTITRHPNSGNILGADDGVNIVHCSKHHLDNNELHMISELDDALDVPCKISYIDQGDDYPITVLRLDEYPLTAMAKSTHLLDKYRKGHFTFEKTIELLSPELIAAFSRQKYEINAEIVYDGLQATPYCVAEGVAVFPWSDEKSIPNNAIFITSEATPENIDIINKCCGVIASYGGLTSHAAVACRQLRIPCISGSRHLSVRFADKNALTTSGETILEGDKICMVENKWAKNGTIIVSNEYHPACSEDIINHISKMVSSISNTNIFGQYPIEFQIHIAELNKALRSIGVKNEHFAH